VVVRATAAVTATGVPEEDQDLSASAQLLSHSASNHAQLFSQAGVSAAHATPAVPVLGVMIQPWVPLQGFFTSFLYA